MLNKKVLITVVVAFLLLLSIPDSGAYATTRAQVKAPDVQLISPTRVVPYTGSLTNPDGQFVVNGAYEFIFKLYDDPTAGNLLWSEQQSGVAVSAGKFSTNLGSITPLTDSLFENQGMWLEVSVRGPGEVNFTTLAPREDFIPLSNVAALACPHSHYSDAWSGTGAFDALYITNTDNDVLHVESYNTDTNHGAIYARNFAATGNGDAINTYSNRGVGLRAGSGLLDGVDATTNASGKSAVYAHTTAGWGVTAVSGAAGGIYPNDMSAIQGVGTADHTSGGKLVGNVYAGATITTKVPASYIGLLVDGGMNLINGGCSGCALSLISMNAGTEDIRKGDLVATIGVQVDAASQQPVLLVKRATSVDDFVIGVAVGPAAPPSDPARSSPETAGKSGIGVTAAGEYVHVMLSGLAQVKVSTTEVSIGEYITAGPTGAVINTSSSSELRALSEVDANGFVWVLIGAR
jgi:hypothetical protein